MQCLATPSDLIGYLTFEADCHVGTVDRGIKWRGGTPMVVGDRIVRVCDVEVVDRCELRTALSELDPNVPVDVYYERDDPKGYAHSPSAADDYYNVTMADMRCQIPTSPSSRAAAEYAAADEAARLAASAHRGACADDMDGSVRLAASHRGGFGVGGGFGMLSASSMRGVGDVASLLTLTNTPSEVFRQQHTLAYKLSTSLDSVDPGRAVIVLSDAVMSPQEEVEKLCTARLGRSPVAFDFGARIRNRVSVATLDEVVRRALEAGDWVLILRGSKSLTLLEALAETLSHAHDGTGHGPRPVVHSTSRVIITAEPHPHFPTYLTHRSKSIRMRTNFSQSTLMYESIGTSVSVRRVATDSLDGDPAQLMRGKKVRMAGVVSIVDIEPREVHTAPEAPPTRVNVSGTVTLVASFSALPGDQFYGIGFAGQRDRVGICSSLGNLYVTDVAGAALSSYHLHEAAVWDVSFADGSTFVTGGEDRLACEWARDAAETDSLVCTATVPCANDVYTVAHTMDGSAYAVGGLMPTLSVKSSSPGSEATVITTNTSSQALCPVTTEPRVASAGGDGTISLVDCASAQLISCTQQHAKKAAAITASGSIIISGSYDGKIRLWDTRASGNQNLQCLKFSQYVTGLAADENYLAASVGTSLYLWDLRNLTSVLGGHPKAWRDLSRAMALDGAARMVVTASPDGVARYWSF